MSNTFQATEENGLPGRTITILRTVTLRGIPGFAIHEYEDEYRVSHIETGAYLTRGGTDGEAFVKARSIPREDIQRKIDATRIEIRRLRNLRNNNQNGNGTGE